MLRPHRVRAGGVVYHVLNRANARVPLFERPEDYFAFEMALEEARERFSTRILAYCAMPNHWHLVLWPRHDDELSAFAGWLTLTHTQRCHAHRQTTGAGHIYQGRFKSFPCQTNEYFLALCRYVERNPLRARLVERAQDWRYSSLRRRLDPDSQPPLALHNDWPVDRPSDWVSRCNRPQSEREEEALRLSIRRGRPLGSPTWTLSAARRLHLESTLRSRGRPRKESSLTSS